MVNAKEGNVRITLSVKETTKQILIEKAKETVKDKRRYDGTRKIGALIDQMVEEKYGATQPTPKEKPTPKLF